MNQIQKFKYKFISYFFIFVFSYSLTFISLFSIVLQTIFIKKRRGDERDIFISSLNIGLLGSIILPLIFLTYRHKKASSIHRFELYPKTVKKSNRILLPDTGLTFGFDYLLNLDNLDLRFIKNNLTSLNWDKKHISDFDILSRSKYVKSKYTNLYKNEIYFNEPIAFRFYPALSHHNINDHSKYIGAYFHNTLLSIYLTKITNQSSNQSFESFIKNIKSNHMIPLLVDYHNFKPLHNFIKGLDHSKFFPNGYLKTKAIFLYNTLENKLLFEHVLDENFNIIDNQHESYFTHLSEFVFICIMALVYIHGAWHLECPILINLGLKSFKNKKSECLPFFKHAEPGVMFKLSQVKELFKEGIVESIGGRDFINEDKTMFEMQNLIYNDLFNYKSCHERIEKLLQNTNTIFKSPTLLGIRKQAKLFDTLFDKIHISDSENKTFLKYFENYYLPKLPLHIQNKYNPNIFNLRNALKQLYFTGSSLHSHQLMFQHIFFTGLLDQFDEYWYKTLFVTFRNTGFETLDYHLLELLKESKNDDTKEAIQEFINENNKNKILFADDEKFKKIITNHENYFNIFLFMEYPFFQEKFHTFNNSIHSAYNLLSTSI